MDSTILHLTHYKAGSQWIAEVLHQATLNSKMFFRLDPIELLNKTIQTKSLYAPVYLNRDEYLLWTGQRNLHEYSGFQFVRLKRKVNLDICEKNKATLQRNNIKITKFFVMRDLRDSTISAYFSFQYSHIETPLISKERKYMRQMPQDEGISYTINEIVREYARIQSTWIDDNDNTKIFRYEEFIENEFNTFRELMDHCEIDISDNNLRQLVNNNSFENLTGRKPGEENKNEHLRSGTQGNWKKYFSSENINLFKEMYGETLIKTGYEKDLNW